MDVDTDRIQFRNCFHGLLLVAQNALQSFSTKKGLFAEPQDLLEVSPAGRFSTRSKKVPSYSSIVFWVRSQIQESKEYKEMVEFLRRQPVISQHLIGTSKGQYAHAVLKELQIIQDMLRFYLEKTGGFLKNTRTTELMYRRVKKHFERPFIETVWVAYLENVTFEAKSVKIAENFRVLSLSDVDKVRLFNTNAKFREFYGGRWVRNLDRVGAIATISFRTKKQLLRKKLAQEETHRDSAEAAIQRMLNTLRVMVPMPVNCSPIVFESRLLPFFNYSFSIGRNEYIEYISSVNIDVSCHRRLRRVYLGLEKAMEDFPELISVFRRLASRDVREVFEDKVIDLFICLEFILQAFLPKKGNRGIRWSGESMALFLSHVLVTRKECRSWIYKQTKRAYKIRNRIVHAQSPKGDEQNCINNVERILRLALTKLILQMTSADRKKMVDWFN